MTESPSTVPANSSSEYTFCLLPLLSFAPIYSRLFYHLLDYLFIFVHDSANPDGDFIKGKCVTKSFRTLSSDSD